MMIRKIYEQALQFKDDISSIKGQNPDTDINCILSTVKEKIKENTKKYFETDNQELRETLRNNLIRCYNVLYYYQAKLVGIKGMYKLDEDIKQLPNIYLVEQLPEKFEIDYELIREIDIANGLTCDQAIELLKWTVNNTRENLNIVEQRRTGISDYVYDNCSLRGACGFSQFSTLYPLERLGLEVTTNNVSEFYGGGHAYGTVIIPIKTDGKIIKKRFLLDCTYRQFFTVPYNVVSRYFDSSPEAGFYVCQDEEQIEFSKELLKNGFIEADLENIKKYLKPFFARSLSIGALSKLDEGFNEFNILGILEQRQGEFDYTEKQFNEWGLNLKITQGKVIK